jgi:hypothetical protein
MHCAPTHTRLSASRQSMHSPRPPIELPESLGQLASDSFSCSAAPTPWPGIAWNAPSKSPGHPGAPFTALRSRSPSLPGSAWQCQAVPPGGQPTHMTACLPSRHAVPPGAKSTGPTRLKGFWPRASPWDVPITRRMYCSIQPTYTSTRAGGIDRWLRARRTRSRSRGPAAGPPGAGAAWPDHAVGAADRAEAGGLGTFLAAGTCRTHDSACTRPADDPGLLPTPARTLDAAGGVTDPENQSIGRFLLWRKQECMCTESQLQEERTNLAR